MKQGLIQDPVGVSEVLLQIFNELKATKGNVISSITGQGSVHRIMTIPNIQDNLLEETIQRKAKQEFALPINETDLTWRVISRVNNQITLFVLAIPKVIIDRLVETFQAAKIKNRILDIKPLALIHFVNRETSMIVNLESYSMSVIIVVNHIPILVRTIPLESGRLTDEAKVDLLGQELTRTVKFYNESNKSNPLPENTIITLTGGLFDFRRHEDHVSNNPNLAVRLKTRTPYQVELPAPPENRPAKLPVAKYAVNLGLALKATK
jgi:hypothetical protein